MKIAMFGQKGIPMQFGGVEKHVEELAVRLVKNESTDVVVYTRPWYVSTKKITHKGVRLQSVSSLKSKHLDAITHTLFSLLHAIVKERPDIYHIHAVGPALLTWVPRLLHPSAKVIVTFHCIDRQHQKWNKFARIMLWAGEFVAMKFAHEVISVSKTLHHYAYEVYHRMTRYIPNGVQASALVPASSITQKYGINENEYILMVARLVRHKGAHYLIEAYEQLNTDKKLVIVGDSAFTDGYVDELKKMAEGNENIIFTGYQSGHMLAELFSNAYVYVLPSESEGLPIALLEAAAYGRAVLASDIPANREIVDQCGVSFKNTSVPDLTEKLQELIANPKLVTELGVAARKFVLEYYLWDDIAKQTYITYQHVCQNVAEPATRSTPQKASRFAQSKV